MKSAITGSDGPEEQCQQQQWKRFDME